MATFGEKLKRLRKQRGWTQDQLGEQVGLHGRHVGKYEIGHALPNAETVVKIAHVFDTTIDYLLRDEMEREQPEGQLRDRDLMRKFEAVEKMGPDDRKIVLALLDAFIKKTQIEQVLQQ